ncbi:MAG TPA: DegT/DnrJ/EryC1/StrS family aminotransferase [Chloroflexota bacterium]|nr:DegT/DnrJ/EryC1/StrS family aminotransferase [Chloroflexota bacterium]
MAVTTPRQIRYGTPVITPEMEQAIVEALHGEPYILAERTKAFERAFAEYIGTRFAMACSSGTAALHLALMAAEIGPGDEVIMPANAYPPVADCIRLVGARPVLVDVDERTGCLDPALIEMSLTPHTKAVVPLHMYGHPTDMNPLMKLAHERSLLLIEDAAHALGSRYRGRMTGSIGDLGIYSTGRKHITTGGVGGMVTTNNPSWAERVERLRNHGRDEGQQKDLRGLDRVQLLGYNYRQSEVLAALGLLQLKHLPGWIEERRANAARYRARFAAMNVRVQPLEELEWAYHSYLHFPIHVERRDELAAFLAERGVETHFIYPVPVHRQRLHAGHVDVPVAGLPVSERLTAEVLTLTPRPGLSADDIDYICDQIEAFFRRG